MDDDEDKARAEAEARRQRILQKSKDRMNVVSGLQQEADTEDEETKASSAARMQAMRRRRFKKGGKGKDKEEKEEETTATATDAAAETAVTPPEAAAFVAEAAFEPAVEETKSKEEEPKAAEPEKEEETTTPTGGEEKKYKGVAKMRRQMLHKKKQEQQAKEEQEDDAAHPMARKRKLKPPMLPIIMYLLTVVLLFLAGLDVGLQHYDDTCLVHYTTAIKQFDVKNLNPFRSKTAPAIQKDLGSDGNDDRARALLEDEFESAGTKFDDDEYVPNIDPLFRVDLDELTRGPGVFMQLTRGAVRIHQTLIAIPISILSIPKTLFQFPPVLCLVAITIRQLVSKIVLGATLPDPQEEDVRNQKEVQDVLDMAKNFVMNMLTTTFPTAVSLLETLRDLRADMYVLLCGVFVGLAYSSMVTGGYEQVESAAEEVPTGGLGDEL